MRRKIILTIILTGLLSVASLCSAQNPVDISSRWAVLMDKDSGRVLYQENPHVRRPMASTTKIMTAILALEKGILDDVVVVSPRAAVVEGSSIWLEEGEEKSLEELVYGLMLRSGNDAAFAIAEHIGGSVENFAFLMTQRARQLGAYNTRFQNPHGLHEEDQYTTAYDLALIARHALGMEKFRQIIATAKIKISWPGHSWSRVLRNQNRLLELYPGGDGIKTGWTTPAGRCFVGSATRDDLQLITVVLNAPNMWEDTMALLDYGFTRYRKHTLIQKGSYIRQVPIRGGVAESLRVTAAADFFLALEDGEGELLDYVFDTVGDLNAPVKKGERVGSLTVYLKEQRLGSVPLLAGEDVPRAGFLYQTARFLRRLFSPGSFGQ